MTQNGLALQFASEFKDDDKIVLTATAQNPNASKYASSRLQAVTQRSKNRVANRKRRKKNIAIFGRIYDDHEYARRFSLKYSRDYASLYKEKTIVTGIAKRAQRTLEKAERMLNVYNFKEQSDDWINELDKYINSIKYLKDTDPELESKSINYAKEYIYTLLKISFDQYKQNENDSTKKNLHNILQNNLLMDLESDSEYYYKIFSMTDALQYAMDDFNVPLVYYITDNYKKLKSNINRKDAFITAAQNYINETIINKPLKGENFYGSIVIFLHILKIFKLKYKTINNFIESYKEDKSKKFFTSVDGRMFSYFKNIKSALEFKLKTLGQGSYLLSIYNTKYIDISEQILDGQLDAYLGEVTTIPDNVKSSLNKMFPAPITEEGELNEIKYRLYKKVQDKIKEIRETEEANEANGETNSNEANGETNSNEANGETKSNEANNTQSKQKKKKPRRKTTILPKKKPRRKTTILPKQKLPRIKLRF